MSYNFGSREWYAEIQKGNVPGHSLVHKFGTNPSVPNGDWAFITNLGQAAHPLSAATTVRVKAGNTNDTAAGTGARSIVIQGIDVAGAEVKETLATSGTSVGDVSSNSYWRVHRAWVEDCGTYGGGNIGEVVIENGAGGTDILSMAATQGQSQDCAFTIPSGYKGYLLSLDATIDASKPADLRLLTRADITNTTPPVKSVRLKNFFDGIQGPFPFKPFSPHGGHTGPTDIWMEARGGGALTEVSADMEILIIEDGY